MPRWWSRSPELRMGRRLRGFAALLLLEAAGVAALGAEVARARRAPPDAALQALVRHLGLTDLALWTEARYTRHPSQADAFSAFQDLPGAPDHFPAGSVVAPPAHLLASPYGPAEAPR